MAVVLLGAVPGARATLVNPQPTAVALAQADGVRRITNAYGPAGRENLFDVYLPDGPVYRRPTVLFIHGGSWEIGDKVEWVAEAEQVARRGWTAVSVNYRRTPTAGWPAPLEDLRRALAVLQARANEFGIDPHRIGAVGDSVGAQLAELLGRPAPGLVPVRSVVAWSGISDLPGLLQQPSSGGCVSSPCRYRGLARKAVEALMRCTPGSCRSAWQSASPAAGLTSGPATYAVVSEHELIDPRQAWALDGALARAGVPSRVRVLPGRVHGRGYQDLVWADSLRFLAATLTPETAPPFPRPRVAVSLTAPALTRLGTSVRLAGLVRPRALGSTVQLQVRTAAGSWRTARVLALQDAADSSGFAFHWIPQQRGKTVWRAAWRGGGGVGVSAPVTVAVQ